MHHLSSRLMSREDKAMKHFFERLIIAFAAAFGTASLVHAEVLIGLSSARTGTHAWVGVDSEEGAEMAVADLNAKGGVLGEPVEMITVDDYCEGEQAVAAAKKLVEAKVAAAFGPLCSGAAIPASKVFAEASVLMISPTATSPKLTEQGFRNIFRIVGRDDLQGKIAGDLLASRWGNKKIAILHDGQAYGKGLAEETKKRLNERGVTEALFEVIQPRRVEYSDIVRKMQSVSVDVLYYAGYAPEAALLLRLARGKGRDLQLVGGDALSVEDFGLIAGPGSDGTLFTSYPDTLGRPDAAAIAARIARGGSPRASFTTYAALQVWARAVEMAGTFETAAVAEALRAQDFDTVLGRIGFDDKGDVTGYDTFVWYQWQGGDTRPVDPDKLAE
jgi:branched-chain amino acid transport system substrate-binding protein